MVAVAGGCNDYNPWASCAIAAAAGPLYIAISAAMVRLRIDDPVDAVAVHCGSGEEGTVDTNIGSFLS